MYIPKYLKYPCCLHIRRGHLFRLNSSSIAGDIARARLMACKDRLGVLSCPYDAQSMQEAKIDRSSSNMA